MLLHLRTTGAFLFYKHVASNIFTQKESSYSCLKLMVSVSVRRYSNQTELPKEWIHITLEEGWHCSRNVATINLKEVFTLNVYSH